MEGKKPRREAARVPAWVMLPVGLGVGFMVAGWAGAVFGGVVGAFLWRSRA